MIDLQCQFNGGFRFVSEFGTWIDRISQMYKPPQARSIMFENGRLHSKVVTSFRSSSEELTRTARILSHTIHELFR